MFRLSPVADLHVACYFLIPGYDYTTFLINSTHRKGISNSLHLRLLAALLMCPNWTFVYGFTSNWGWDSRSSFRHEAFSTLSSVNGPGLVFDELAHVNSSEQEIGQSYRTPRTVSLSALSSKPHQPYRINIQHTLRQGGNYVQTHTQNGNFRRYCICRQYAIRTKGQASGFTDGASVNIRLYKRKPDTRAGPASVSC